MTTQARVVELTTMLQGRGHVVRTASAQDKEAALIRLRVAIEMTRVIVVGARPAEVTPEAWAALEDAFRRQSYSYTQECGDVDGPSTTSGWKVAAVLVGGAALLTGAVLWSGRG